MDKNQIDQFVATCAPDADTAWQWLRELSDLGYSMQCTTETIKFTKNRSAICGMVERGAIKWHPSNGAAPKQTWTQRILGGGLATFADPVTAARYWETELASMPAEVKITGQAQTMAQAAQAPTLAGLDALISQVAGNQHLSSADKYRSLNELNAKTAAASVGVSDAKGLYKDPYS